MNNINVAAYTDGYQGIGGYGYCHYLFVTDNSPCPDCLRLHRLHDLHRGRLLRLGQGHGRLLLQPQVAEATENTRHHQTGGYVDGVSVYEAKNDRGYDWWTTDCKLVLEDPSTAPPLPSP